MIAPLAVIDRELLFLDAKLASYRRRADKGAVRRGERIGVADDMAERCEQRRADLRAARAAVVGMVSGGRELLTAYRATLSWQNGRTDDEVADEFEAMLSRFEVSP